MTDNSTDILIKGADLTEAQKSQLGFNGMKNPEWVKNHSFWFTADGKERSKDPKRYYPVCKSLSHLPY